MKSILARIIEKRAFFETTSDPQNLVERCVDYLGATIKLSTARNYLSKIRRAFREQDAVAIKAVVAAEVVIKEPIIEEPMILKPKQIKKDFVLEHPTPAQLPAVLDSFEKHRRWLAYSKQNAPLSRLKPRCMQANLF